MVSSYLRGGVADADGSTATVGDGVADKISFLAPDSKRGMAMPMPFTSRGSLTCAMRRTSNVEQVTGRVLIAGCLRGRKIEIALRCVEKNGKKAARNHSQAASPFQDGHRRQRRVALQIPLMAPMLSSAHANGAPSTVAVRR